VAIAAGHDGVDQVIAALDQIGLRLRRADACNERDANRDGADHAVLPHFGGEYTEPDTGGYRQAIKKGDPRPPFKFSIFAGSGCDGFRFVDLLGLHRP
jgi:hypothetical protein